MGPAQDGLQQRSEWPRILHSAVHAHSPRQKEKEFPTVSARRPLSAECQLGSGAAEEEGVFKNLKAHAFHKDNFI